MKTFTLTTEEIVDLQSILRYCATTNPSHELKHSARKFISKMYQSSLFESEGTLNDHTSQDRQGGS